MATRESNNVRIARKVETLRAWALSGGVPTEHRKKFPTSLRQFGTWEVAGLGLARIGNRNALSMSGRNGELMREAEQWIIFHRKSLGYGKRSVDAIKALRRMLDAHKMALTRVLAQWHSQREINSRLLDEIALQKREIRVLRVLSTMQMPPKGPKIGFTFN